MPATRRRLQSVEDLCLGGLSQGGQGLDLHLDMDLDVLRSTDRDLDPGESGVGQFLLHRDRHRSSSSDEGIQHRRAAPGGDQTGTGRTVSDRGDGDDDVGLLGRVTLGLSYPLGGEDDPLEIRQGGGAIRGRQGRESDVVPDRLDALLATTARRGLTVRPTRETSSEMTVMVPAPTLPTEPPPTR